MELFQSILSDIDDFVWGVPLIVLILATGIYLTIRVGALQIRHLPLALKYMVKNEQGGAGEVSSFGALCTAMSATIGTCLLYTSPSPRDTERSRMPSSA